MSDKGDVKEWRNGLFNLSFDDDCGGYLALLFPSVVDSTPTGDGLGSPTGDGGTSAAKKEGSSPGAEPVNERSRLAGSAAASYGGRSISQLSDISQGGSAGAAGDTRPLISDADGGAQESALRILGEVWFPFLLAGLGSVLAGLVLDIVQVRVTSFLVVRRPDADVTLHCRAVIRILASASFRGVSYRT